MSEWKKAAEARKKAQDDIDEKICIVIADKEGRSKEEKINKFVDCMIKRAKMSPAERAALRSTLPPPETQVPPSPPPTPQDLQREACEREAAKARNPKVRAHFMEWCLVDVPAKGRPAYAPAAVVPESIIPKALSEGVAETEDALRFEVPRGKAKRISGGVTRTHSTALTIPQSVLADIRQFVITELVPDAAFIERWKTQLMREYQEEAARKQNPKKNRRKYVQQWLVLFEEGDADQITEVLKRKDADWVLQVPGDAWAKLIAWQVAQRLAQIYERVFAQGVQYYCREVRQYLSCTNFAAPIFFEHYASLSGEKGKGETFGAAHLRDIAKQYGRGSSNVEDIVYDALHNTSVAMQTVVKKLRSFQAFLLKESHVSGLMSYLLTGYLPTPLRYAIAKEWVTLLESRSGEEKQPVSPGWVRDVTFGWRRRLDPLLAPEFQMNAIPETSARCKGALQHTIWALFYSTPDKASEAQDRLILQILAKKHLLHFLIHPDRPIPPGLLSERRKGQQKGQSRYVSRANALREILAQNYRRILETFHASYKFGPAEYGDVVQKVYPNHMTLTAQEFEQAATEVIADTQAAIAELQTQYVQEAVPSKKSFYKRLIELKEVYLKTCELLQNPIVVKNIGDLDLFEVVLPAAKQFHAFASVIGAIRLDLGPRPKGKRREVTLNTHLKDRCGLNRLRGVLGAILARACFAKYLLKGKPVMDVARAIVEKMTPEAVLTAPFCAVEKVKAANRWGRKTPKRVYPLDLTGVSFSYPPLFRQGNFGTLTTVLQQQVAAQAPQPHLIFVLPQTMKLLDREKEREGTRKWNNIPVARLLEEVLEAKARDTGWGRRLVSPQERTYLEHLFSEDRLEALMAPFRLPHQEGSEDSGEATKRMGTGVPMEAHVSKRMRTILAHPQVELLTCRVIPPAFGNAKVVVQFVFHGPRDTFAFAPSFVAATPRAKGQQTDPPKTPLTAKGYQGLTAGHLLGIDFNRISPFIMEMATPDQALEIKEGLQEVFKIGQKLRWIDYCGTTHAPGLFQTLLADPEFVQALRPQPDLVQALEQEVAQTPEEGPARDLLVQWRRQMLLARIQHALRDAISNSADRVVQEQAKIALRHLWRAWAQFRRGLYLEIAAVQRALAVCLNELEALDRGTPNWGRIYHHLTHRHPNAYPKWKPEVLTQKLRGRVARLQKELTLLHQRKARLKTQLDLEVSLAGARILIQQGADAVAAEDLTLTTRDKPKVLAKYVTDMPKQQEIVERMALWAGYYHTAVRRLKDPTVPQFEVKPYFVDPRGTSKVHAHCGGALRAVAGKSDLQQCAKCGAEVPRHSNSAQLIAQRGIKSRQEEATKV